MTSRELLESLEPNRTEELTAQSLTDGLSINMSGVYSQLIKEAARCNNYNSDIIYDINAIEKQLKDFREGDEWDPMFVGFRRHGVDGTGYVMCRIENLERRYSVIYKEYFALYSIDVKPDTDGWYKLIFNTYNT